MVRFICSAPELFFRSSTNPVEQQMKMVQADRSEPGADVSRWVGRGQATLSDPVTLPLPQLVDNHGFNEDRTLGNHARCKPGAANKVS